MFEVFAIQRRCGERTQDLYARSLNQFADQAFVEVESILEATRESLRRASKWTSIQNWTVFVDADIRLYDAAIDTIKSTLYFMTDDRISDVRFAIDDAILGQPRFGVHVHRNTAIQAFHETFLDNVTHGLSAESLSFINFRAAHGLTCITIPIVIGSHDYGQYRKDLYVKYIVQGKRRESDRIRSALQMRPKSPDVEVAMAGIIASDSYHPTTIVNRKKVDAAAAVLSLGYREKSLTLDSVCAADNGEVRPLITVPFPYDDAEECFYSPNG